MSCRICQNKATTRYISLFVNGSEGLNICNSCEMVLVEFVRLMMNLTFHARKVAYLELKREEGKDGNTDTL